MMVFYDGSERAQRVRDLHPEKAYLQNPIPEPKSLKTPYHAFPEENMTPSTPETSTEDKLAAIVRVLTTCENLAWWVEQGDWTATEREAARTLMTQLIDQAREALGEL
jgi:hypothetical protein